MSGLTAAEFERVARCMAGQDPTLAGLVEKWGIPPFWSRPPGFATLALFIVEQQVSLASAKAVFERVTAAIGGMSPDRVAGIDPDVLGGAGLTRQKQRYLIGLARLVEGGELDLDDLEDQPDDVVRSRLLAVSGVGPWTADVYLLSALRRPDLWPTGDRALQVGVGESLRLDQVPDSRELEGIGERWRPHRSVAARLIWHSYLQRRGRAETEVAGLG